MNILILSWRGPGHPNAGGAEQVTLEHAKAWVKGGHDVTLFTSMFKGGKFQETVSGVNILRQGEQTIGVKVRALVWYLFKKHKKFDLVIDEFHGIPFFTPLFVRVRKVAFIHEVAGEVWKYNPWPRPFNLIPSYFGPRLEPLIFKYMYKKIPFITVSASTKDDLIRLGIPKHNVHIVQNGLTPFLSKKKIEKEKIKTAIYLGAISADKGTLEAIYAFGEIERKDDDWQYWLVGSGTQPYIHELEKAANDLGIGNKLKIWGYVSENKKFELLVRAHILVNPSVHEGWGLVNIEANSVGTPVVGYRVHGIKDSVMEGKTGILVSPHDYRALAQELLKLVRDKERYNEFSQSCKKWAAKFDWRKSTKESLELIESL